jgi:tRNA1Val (adenine37-N6)-methyltransferase
VDLTEGTLLAGRVRYWQKRDGYRSGIEPVLLAAACPARPGERVLELGTGAGAALLCLAARVPGVGGTGVELDPALAALARRNLAANGAADRVHIAERDAATFAADAPLDHAISNPPWHDAASTPSPVPGRRRAKQAGSGVLAAWCAAAAGALRAGGTLTLALPAALTGQAFTALADAGLGTPALFPLWPREGSPARLVLLQARRGNRGQARVLPGAVLHAGAGWSAWANSVLRDGAPIDLSAPTKEGNAVPSNASLRGTVRAALLLALSLLVWSAPSHAADHLTADQVRAAVAEAGAQAGKVDLSGKDMSGDDLTDLDLTGANLKGANLSGANLHGVKLVGADLTGADLSKADLTFAWIIRANFTRARLRGATMQTVVTSAAMDNTPDQAATFVGADFSGANITVHFSFDDMRGATFVGANMTVVMANQSMGLLRTEFMSANLDGADFTGAGLGHVTFRYAKLNGARFGGADLTSADFTGAYLTGADFTGANVQGANFDGATLTGVTGLSQAAGQGSGR